MQLTHVSEIPEVVCCESRKLLGLKNTTTGDTLLWEKDQVILESMAFPETVIQVSYPNLNQSRPR